MDIQQYRFYNDIVQRGGLVAVLWNAWWYDWSELVEYGERDAELWITDEDGGDHWLTLGQEWDVEVVTYK